jgi:hypothetical protein
MAVASRTSSVETMAAAARTVMMATFHSTGAT